MKYIIARDFWDRSTCRYSSRYFYNGIPDKLWVSSIKDAYRFPEPMQVDKDLNELLIEEDEQGNLQEYKEGL